MDATSHDCTDGDRRYERRKFLSSGGGKLFAAEQSRFSRRRRDSVRSTRQRIRRIAAGTRQPGSTIASRPDLPAIAALFLRDEISSTRTLWSHLYCQREAPEWRKRR